MPFDYGRNYTQNQLPSELFNVPSGEVRSYEGIPYRVINANGGRRLEAPSGNEIGFRGGFPGITDPVDTAKRLQEFNIQANQPAISTLQGQVDPLKQRYTDLIASIKGQFDIASNRQTLATNTELGARGIDPRGGLYQQQLANAQLPVSSAYGALTAQTGMGEQQDLMQIANQIASLQRGNPEAAMTGATNILGIQQQGQNVAAQLALQRQLAQNEQAYRMSSLGIQGQGLDIERQRLALSQQGLPSEIALRGAEARLAGGKAKQYDFLDPNNIINSLKESTIRSGGVNLDNFWKG